MYHCENPWICLKGINVGQSTSHRTPVVLKRACIIFGEVNCLSLKSFSVPHFKMDPIDELLQSLNIPVAHEEPKTFYPR
jgi:hypothetical protein